LRAGITYTREKKTMNARKFSHKKLLDSCAEVREDDGIDPREFFRKERTNRKTDRKTLQLCAQIADTLNGLLAECHDDMLQVFQVASVIPAPDATQLLVTVCPAIQPTSPMNPEEIMKHLSEASGWLRSEVAGAITRKRAPKLLFQVTAVWPRKEELR
jgi:ribosome-binding factor A